MLDYVSECVRKAVEWGWPKITSKNFLEGPLLSSKVAVTLISDLYELTLLFLTLAAGAAERKCDGSLPRRPGFKS